jgi:hypothetical protein
LVATVADWLVVHTSTLLPSAMPVVMAWLSGGTPAWMDCSSVKAPNCGVSGQNCSGVKMEP